MIDLHTHTTASDGIYTPEGIIDLAAENGVTVLAVTDHDTVDGIPAAMGPAGTRGITLVPGIEFSCEFAHGSLHMLGYYIDFRNSALCDRVAQLAMFRETRAFRMIEDLNRHDVNISFDEVYAEANGGAIGKPHVARILVRKGYARSFEEVFSQFLEEGKPGHVKKEKVTAQEALELIRKAGGVPVVAHPATLNLGTGPEFAEFIADLKSSGLRGIEAYSDMHGPEEVEFYRDTALKHGLLVTGGSDFHGDKKEQLGYYRAGLPIPEDLFPPLQKEACVL